MSLTSPRTTFAIDPGKDTCGVALFVNERLVACSFLSAANTFLLGKNVQMWWWAERDRRSLPERVDSLVTEGQQIYPGGRSVNPNDLLPLSFLCGCVQSRIEAHNYLMPLPRAWKGSLKKEIFTRRILSRCKPDELQIIKNCNCVPSKLHNVVDAVGLGLWALGAVRTDSDEEGVV